MDRRSFVLAAALSAALLGPAQAETTLNVATAGDQNMVDYINDYLGPRFEKAHPGVHVRAIGTGPGDAGSLAIEQKLSAEAKSGAPSWDIDVAVIHQRGAANMVGEHLLAKYRDQVPTSALVTSEKANNALGTDVSGYVLPMFDSQVAIAYNPAVVKSPPRTYAELVEWAKKNPKQFGYNGIKGGMAGIGFVMGWVNAYAGLGPRLIKGPYEEADTPKIDAALASLRDFNQYATLTPGNAGTLDALNRGEITMGAVWADMFYTWQADGRLSPDLKLVLPSPGMPGQPMYYAIPEKAAQPQLAREFVSMATSPEVQAEGIVQRFNWYPGIDAAHVQAKLDKKLWDKLFVDITPQDLKQNAMPFPISPYFTTVLNEYEKVTAK
ncbi:MAG: extracellular solute-binding protein [Acetobacteraceae bacterium]|nr:extracellular solute-binding protein [Acetobacteraceae bacterium]